MTFKADIYSYLIAQTELTDLVGERIYPLAAPTSAGDGPFIVWQILNQQSEYHLNPINSKSDLTTRGIQFSIWSETPSQNELVEIALRSTIEGLVGVTMGGTPIRAIFLSQYIETTEDPVDGTQNFKYRTTLNFNFHFFEV